MRSRTHKDRTALVQARHREDALRGYVLSVLAEQPPAPAGHFGALASRAAFFCSFVISLYLLVLLSILLMVFVGAVYSTNPLRGFLENWANAMRAYVV